MLDRGRGRRNTVRKGAHEAADRSPLAFCGKTGTIDHLNPKQLDTPKPIFEGERLVNQRLMLVTAVLSFSTTIAAFGDTRLEIQHTETGKQAESQAVLITSGKVRMEQSRAEDTILLYHQSDNTFYAIEPKQKSYIVIDPEKAGAMVQRATQMQQQMMKQLEEQMANMPEAQREQMKAMMAQMEQGMPQAQQPEKVRYEARGDGGSAAGISCKWYEAYEGNRKARELCLATPRAIGMAGADKETMMAMVKAIQAFAAQFGNSGMFVDDMPEGFPVRVRHLDSNGQLTSEQEVATVSKGSLDPSLFEVPSGYERKEMPSMPQ